MIWLHHLSEDDLAAMFRSLCERLPDEFAQALWNGFGVPEIKRLLNYSVAYVAELNSLGTMTFTGVVPSGDGNSGQSTRFGDALGNKFRLMSRPLLSLA